MIKRILYVLLFLILLLHVLSAMELSPIPITMQDAVKYAVDQNPRIRVAEAGVEKETGVKMGMWSLPQPEFILSYEGVPRGTYFDTWASRKMMFGQRIEFPLKYLFRIQQQSLLVESAGHALDMEKLKLTTDVKVAYIDALLTKEKYSLALENLRISSDLLKKAKLRYELGEEDSIDYLRAKLQKDRSENAIIAARTDHKETMEKLILLLTGKKNDILNMEIELIDSLKYTPIDINKLELGEKGLSNHFRLQIAEKELKAASQALALAKSSYLPDFNFVYFKENKFNNPGFWGMQFGMSFPLWFLSDQRGQIAEARAIVKIADWNRAHEENHLRSEYRTAVFILKEAEKQVKRFNEEILREAEQVFKLASLNYKVGETSYIDLIFAQQSLIETRSEYLDALASYNKSVIRIELAVGHPLH
ncbi:TolC family protein [candidate division KSB1 bacterium]